MTLSEQLYQMENRIISVLRDETNRNIEEFRKEFKNDSLNFKDEIISEMKTIRLEQAVTSNYKRTLVDHEERIAIIEKHTP